MTHGTDFDVVVIGNVGIDTNVYFQTDQIDFNVEANFTENLDYVGQAGGYAARGYAQLGLKTAFIGYVGDDYQGEFIRSEFERDGIDMLGLFIDPSGTSRSVNFMYRDGRRKNFYDGKAHMSLKPDLALCEKILDRARLAHFSIPNWARYLLPLARKHHLVIASDIQDVIDANDQYRQDFIAYSDLLFFSSANHANPVPLIDTYLKRNPDQVIVSGMGAEGAALGSKDGIRIVPPIDMTEPVVDTNGAGDELAVGFLVSHVFQGYSMEQSLLRGQIAARYTCTQKASTSHLITAHVLDTFYKQLA